MSETPILSLDSQEAPIEVVGWIILNSKNQIYLCENRQWFLVLPGWKVDKEDEWTIQALQSWYRA
jgi:hypothetical protein